MKVRVWAGRHFFKPTSRRPKTGVCATLARYSLLIRGVGRLPNRKRSPFPGSRVSQAES
jgi:hypothetical protein